MPRYGIDEPWQTLEGMRWVSASKIPHRSPEGEIIGVIGISMGITEPRNAMAKIRALLREKELLLKEVHHRIKNNMTTIIGLLSLQAASAKEPAAGKARDRPSRVPPRRRADGEHRPPPPAGPSQAARGDENNHGIRPRRTRRRLWIIPPLRRTMPPMDIRSLDPADEIPRDGRHRPSSGGQAERPRRAAHRRERRRRDPGLLSIYCTATRGELFGEEDYLFADYLSKELRGEPSDFAAIGSWLKGGSGAGPSRARRGWPSSWPSFSPTAPSLPASRAHAALRREPRARRSAARSPRRPVP